ncbi:MAG: hypothetical protein IJ305_09495, partial [Oscillospiraceae bacterium]|nr:hypothetical protein [Oscillospiraceae bacterium]
MEFAADKYCVEFGGVKLFVEEYAFARSAAVGETVLLNGDVAFRNGGEKAARITLSGKSESPCAHLLDTLAASGEAVALEYGGMTFEGAVLVSYACKGKSGSSEAVTAEFVCV